MTRNFTPDPRRAPRARAIGYGVRLSEQEYTVRAARPAEAPAILNLWQEERSTHATTPDRPEDVHRLLADIPGSLLVADAGGALVGALIAAWDGWRGNMYRLAVLREHRRCDVGLALVRAGEDYLRRQGAYRITALVGYEDETASAFWESAGYPQDRQIGRRVRNL